MHTTQSHLFLEHHDTIMTLHTTNVLTFSRKGQSTNGYRQQFSKGQRLIHVTSQGNYLYDQLRQPYLVPSQISDEV